MSQTIAILMPGDMGHGCGKVFRQNDFRVVTCLNKRSVRTKQLAKSSSIEDLGTIEVGKYADYSVFDKNILTIYEFR